LFVKRCPFTQAHVIAICGLAWIGALLWPLRLTAEGPRDFLIQNWTREDGLPGNTVTAVSQTPDGYLWVGTPGGLARFDGERFVTVDPDPAPKNSHRDRAVVCLYTDRSGGLWIGLGDGRLFHYRKGVCRSFNPPSRQTADHPLQKVVEGASRELWMVNHEGLLNYLRGDQFRAPSVPGPFTHLAAGKTGQVWLGGRESLVLVEGGNWTPVWEAAREPGFQIEALVDAREGGCWVAGKGQVRRFKPGAAEEIRLITPSKQGETSALLEDRQGNLWLGSYGGGVDVLPRHGSPRRITRGQGLPSDLVRCLFEDQEGNIWAGLEGRGLVRIREATFASYGRAEGLSGETVLCLAEGADGEIWIGTNGDGVHCLKEGRVTHYGPKEGLSNPFVWALLRDRAGVIWAGTWGGGLFKLENARFIPAHPAGAEAAPVVLAMHEDRNGAIWLGQRVAEGRKVDVIETNALKSFFLPGELPRIEVRAITETPDGDLWFGTMEEGLFRFRTGDFSLVGSGLPAGPVSSLHVDHGGTLWVGLPGSGVAFRDQDRFWPIPAARNLLDDNLNQITDDGLGYLWCGLKSGIVRVKAQDLRRLAKGEINRLDWRRFTKSDGLPSNECSGSGCRTREGRIWFPTGTGVAVVDPQRLANEPPPPPVVIEEVRLAGRLLPLAAGPHAVGASDTANVTNALAYSTSTLSIPAGSGPLDIRFTALSFVNPERLRFRYQLVGLDTAAIEGGETREVRYSYLPAGHYEFRVAASHEGGMWNPAQAGLAFVVQPHYLQTWWFRLAGLVLMVGAGAGTARYILTRRLATLEQQRALESERSRIAQDLHDDLGTSLTEINMLSSLAGSPSSSPAEVKDSLDSINAKSLELVKALDEIVWAVNPKNDSLPNLVNYLCLYAQEFLRPSGIQCRLEVPRGLPDLPLNAEQRHTLFLATKEALANAAKHSGASELRFQVVLNRSHLTLLLCDNGNGFDPSVPKDHRNGLQNLRTRMQSLGGVATISSVPGKGTRVHLRLPL
jgi:signal transduction histidine kinase/ligand-binding sensor domain-containing protein